MKDKDAARAKAIQGIKEQLEGDQVELQAELEELRAQLIVQRESDVTDRATHVEEINMVCKKIDNVQAHLKENGVALGLIARDDYGWCEECGLEIPIKRLIARPAATLCTPCGERREYQERQFGSVTAYR